MDIPIAMQSSILAAWDEELGTCWIGALREDAKKALGIPPSVRVLAMTPLGYPVEEKGLITERRLLEEIVHHDRW